jgi:hypothetical protein
LAASLVGSAAFGFDIQPVGSIQDSLHTPTSVAVSGDQVAILEPFAREIKIYTAEGALSRRLEIEGHAVGLDRLDETAYVYCDRSQYTVMAVDIGTGQQKVFAAEQAAGADPVDLQAVSTGLAVLDASVPAIRYLSLSGLVQSVLPINGLSSDNQHYLTSFAIDTAAGAIFVLDQLQGTIHRLSMNGSLISSFGAFGSGDAEITRGGELAVDRHGRVFVSDRFQGRILIFSGNGDFIESFQPFDNAATLPTGLCVDEMDVLYVVATSGSGVNTFYAPFVPLLYQAAFVQTDAPLAGAEIDPDSVTLRASVLLMDSSLAVTGMDMELFDDTTQGPMADTSVMPVLAASTTMLPIVLNAVWTIPTELESGQDYFWRARVRTSDQTGLWSGYQSFATIALPGAYELYQNYPNPFNPSTTIEFSLPVDCRVRLEVINMLGQRVRVLLDTRLDAGSHEVIWDSRNDNGSEVSSGVYFYRIATDDFVKSRKMVLLK